MGIRSWLFRKVILTPDNLGYIIENLQDAQSEMLKQSILDTLQDEEVGSAVVQYGDALFDRYKKKFFATIGGMQKGVNYQMDGIKSQMNPLSGLIDEDGNPSLSNLLGLVLSRSFMNQQTSQTQNPAQYPRQQPNQGRPMT